METMGFYGKQIDGKEAVIKTRAKDVLWDEQKTDYYLRKCPKCGAEQRRVGGVGLMFVGAVDSGGILSEIREHNGKKYRHCYACHYEFEVVRA